MEEYGSAAGHQDSRRTLMMIYIHGFMGNDMSFQRFPAHMHEFLRISLEATHSVHTKIYPRYKTYRTIDVATENFSRWLEPHEGPNTDVVLVGHSMGGLLAADVALLSSPAGADGRSRPRHRILGTVSLDSPLLGLHPGIITAGIASLFRKSPEPPGGDAWAAVDRGKAGAVPPSPGFPALSPSSSLSPDPPAYSELDDMSPAPSMGSSAAAQSYFTSDGSSISSSSSSKRNAGSALTAIDNIISIGRSATAIGRSDPHYNPPFFNDVQFKDRGFLRNVWHFAQKRKVEGESLIDAATDHIVRHLQFGKCLADPRGLHARYDAVRALEDEGMETRIRFVNYYTVSTGRPKKPRDGSRSPSRALHSTSSSRTSFENEAASVGRTADTSTATTTGGLLHRPDEVLGSSQLTTPRLSIEDHSAAASSKSIGKPNPTGVAGLRPDQDTATEPSEDGSDAGTPELRSISPTPEENLPSPIPEAKLPPPLPFRPAPKPADELSLEKPEHDHPIPPAPQEPQSLDVPQDATPEERKRLEKEHKQAWKKYEQDVKSRIKAIKERDKAMEKERAKREKEKEKREKEDRKREKEEQKRLLQEEAKREKEAKENREKEDEMEQRREQRISQVNNGDAGLGGSGGGQDGSRGDDNFAPDAVARLAADAAVAGTDDRGVLSGDKDKEGKKSKKLRKFCTVPRKRSNGSRDECWVEVYMEGVDEIGAHCGLFFPGPQYEKLIGDVGMRIQGWVHEDASRRAILGL